VSGNSAIKGGGVWNVGTLALFHVTLSDNHGGGIAAYDRERCFPDCPLPPMELGHSLVDGDCTLCTASEGQVHCDPLADRAGRVDSAGHNIESPGDTCGLDQPTDQENVAADDLKLGPLQDNGGPTMTHALGASSVALDVIPEADCTDPDGQPLTTDQRGEPRPSGDGCDVGSFEAPQNQR